MKREAISFTEKRWALVYDYSNGLFFLGKHCWPLAKDHSPKIEIFRTRQEARLARKSCCYYKAKIVRVEVIVRELRGGDANVS